MFSKYSFLTDKDSLELDDDNDPSSAESLLDPTVLRARGQKARCKPSWRISAIFMTGTIILCTNLFTFWLATRLSLRGLDSRHLPGTLTQTSVFSPIHNRINLPLVDKMVDASPAANASNPDHIYRLPPSPEVDAAWDKITDIGMFPVSREDIVKMQKDPDVSIVPPEAWGMGTDEHGDPMYFMEIDVFHQLHCLNALRKGMVHTYDYYWGQYGFVPKSNFERHLNHCLDIIRQALMCHADVEAVVFNWRETQDFAYPDFGVHRTCKDWDALVAWTEANKMPDMEARYTSFVKPEDVSSQLPAPPDLPVEGVDGVVRIGQYHYVKPLTGLEGVPYCLATGQPRDPKNVPGT